MLSDETQEKLAKKLSKLIEELNNEIIKTIGESIKQFATLKPSDAYKLDQMLKYGADYNKIINKISEITKLGEREIENIFKRVALENQNWAKTFYEFRGLEFVPYGQNKPLKNIVDAMTKLAQNEFRSFVRGSAFMEILPDGRRKMTKISAIYGNEIEKAVLSITQGTSDYQSVMRNTIKNLANSGIKCSVPFERIDKDTGEVKKIYRSLESVVRTNILDGMRNVSNAMQEEFGKQFGADGVEISVHENPAIDHEHAQGHQFSKDEFAKLQNGEMATDYEGEQITLDHDGKNGYRPISTMNCYHYEFAIVLGVSKPLYTKKQLKKINTRNHKGFEFEGKHYTMYEGTQLQRKIENKIRKLKTEQIGARATGDMDLVDETQGKIKVLSKKYKELSEASGLSIEKQRMSVSGYKRVKT